MSRGNAFGKLKLDGSLVWNDQPSGNRTRLLSRRTGCEQDRDQYFVEICAEQGTPPLAHASHTRGQARISSAGSCTKTITQLDCRVCSQLHTTEIRWFSRSRAARLI